MTEAKVITSAKDFDYLLAKLKGLESLQQAIPEESKADD